MYLRTSGKRCSGLIWPLSCWIAPTQGCDCILNDIDCWPFLISAYALFQPFTDVVQLLPLMRSELLSCIAIFNCVKLKVMTKSKISKWYKEKHIGSHCSMSPLEAILWARATLSFFVLFKIAEWLHQQMKTNTRKITVSLSPPSHFTLTHLFLLTHKVLHFCSLHAPGLSMGSDFSVCRLPYQALLFLIRCCYMVDTLLVLCLHSFSGVAVAALRWWPVRGRFDPGCGSAFW